MSIRNILTMVINHAFYENGYCRNFHVQPDTITNLFLEKNRMTVRYVGNSWKLFSDIEADQLWIPDHYPDHCIQLFFTLSSSDENFYKTIQTADDVNSIKCVCNKNGTFTLQAHTCENTSCVSWYKQPDRTGTMNWHICLNVNKSEMFVNSTIYSINFNVKDVFWKYIVCVSNGQEAIGVVDIESKIKFTPGILEEYPYQKKAISFISDSKIALSEFDTHTFRLVIKKGNIEKILIKRLPVATPSGVQYKDSEKKDLVSLIFINT